MDVQNKEAINDTSKEIKDIKEKLIADEIKLIKGRTKEITDSYDAELALIERNRDADLEALDQRFSRGTMGEASYVQAKADINGDANVKAYNEAVTQRDKLDGVEGASVEEKKAAQQAVDDANKTSYDAEVERANSIREQQESDKEEREEELEEESKKRDEEDEHRKETAAGIGAWIMAMYTDIADKLLEISIKAVELVSNGNIFMDAIANNAKNATDEIYHWTQMVDQAEKKAKGYKDAIVFAGAVWVGLYKDLAKRAAKLAVATKEKLNVLVDIKKLNNTEINDLSNIEQIQGRLNSLKKTYIYLGEDDLKNLFEAKRALQEQLNMQREINAEKSGVDLSAISAKLEAAKAAGANIDDYGFDPAAIKRLEQLEKETKELDAQIAQQEYADALHLQQLVARGALQEDIDLYRIEAEHRINDMRNPEALRDLEMEAISSRLDVEKINMQIINDMRIAQYEAELLREQELHDIRIENIRIENEAKLAAIDVEETKAFPEANGLDTYTSRFTGYATGGQIPGESTIDSVPVLARPGEWFIRNESAKNWTSKFGAGFMNGINDPLSAAGRGIASALSGGVSTLPMPEVVQAPKVAFATGGQVSKQKEDSMLTNVLDKLAGALSNQNMRTTAEDQPAGKNITINLKSEKTQVSGKFAESDAKNLFKLLQENQMVTG
jgi:hypothetical protein